MLVQYSIEDRGGSSVVLIVRGTGGTVLSLTNCTYRYMKKMTDLGRLFIKSTFCFVISNLSF